MSVFFGEETDKPPKWILSPDTYIWKGETLRGVKAAPKVVAVLKDVPAPVPVPEKASDRTGKDAPNGHSVWNRILGGGGQSYRDEIKRLEKIRGRIDDKYFIINDTTDKLSVSEYHKELGKTKVRIGQDISEMDRHSREQLFFPAVECYRVKSAFNGRNVSYDRPKALKRTPYGFERLAACYDNGIIKRVKPEPREKADAFDDPNITMYIPKNTEEAQIFAFVTIIFVVRGDKWIYEFRIGNIDEHKCRILRAAVIAKNSVDFDTLQIAGEDDWSMYIKQALSRALDMPPLDASERRPEGNLAYRRVSKLLNSFRL